MMNIRPVSDLRNKYPEIEEMVLKEDQAVYLTKNGYGSMVVLSIEKYEDMVKIIDQEKALESRFGVIDIDEALEEAEAEANNPKIQYYTHEEMKKSARRIIDDK